MLPRIHESAQINVELSPFKPANYDKKKQFV